MDVHQFPDAVPESGGNGGPRMPVVNNASSELMDSATPKIGARADMETNLSGAPAHDERRDPYGSEDVLAPAGPDTVADGPGSR